MRHFTLSTLLALYLLSPLGRPAVCIAQAPPGPSGPSSGGTSALPVMPGVFNPDDFPPLEKTLEGFEKVVSTIDGKPSLYTLWIRKRDGQVFAELPREFFRQKHFIALTVASGERYAGLQAGDLYVYWRQYDKRLALIEPNVATRSTGDSESKASVQRLFTDRVIVDVPIVTIVPRGGPIIDLDQLLLGQAEKFFGSGVRVSNTALTTIKTAKAFPENIEIGFEVPMNNGRLQTLHYSISLIPESSSFKPRAADERIGYFVTGYSDLGKFVDAETRTRYINRWHLEKADSSLKISPPKNPIVFYIEHTTPIRYRRWVRQGLLYWNKAFERVGISNAIEANYQDAPSAAHMEKDPEDVRYNFIRWLNNDEGTAIGPSRVNPLTGQILDADIILTDGWIRHFWKQYNQVLPRLAMEGFNAETLAWLQKKPSWDPRVRLAPPGERDHMLAMRALEATKPYGGHPLAQTDPVLMGDDEYDGLVGRSSQTNGMCQASIGKALDMAAIHLHLAAIEGLADSENTPAAADEEKDPKKDDKDSKEKDEKKEEKKDLIDGIPEEFIGPLLAELVAHEVGHTLGLRHNFKASSIYSLTDINSNNFKSKKPLGGSVMDYTPVNINMESGETQGDYTLIDLGPYDLWAIEYGYTFENDLKPILARVAEPELAYATDEDTGGPDPLARRYDFSKNPLDYAKNQMRLARFHRQHILEKFVKDGESWSKARKGYEMTLGFQTAALNMMANWIGGSYIHRDRKGDKNGRPPIEVVPASTQREAINFVIENAFQDNAFGLTPDLLTRMTNDRWLDGDDYADTLGDEPAWPVHDRIMGIQASALTMLMNPTTLRRVYDNEFRTPSDKEALSLPEMLDILTKAVWSELDQPPAKDATARKPTISSLRRNLQREHLDRLVDLSLTQDTSNAATRAIANLSRMQLQTVRDKVAKLVETPDLKLDPYTEAHVKEAREIITKALDAQFIYNSPQGGGNSGIRIIFGQEPPKP